MTLSPDDYANIVYLAFSFPQNQNTYSAVSSASLALALRSPQNLETAIYEWRNRLTTYANNQIKGIQNALMNYAPLVKGLQLNPSEFLTLEMATTLYTKRQNNDNSPRFVCFGNNKNLFDKYCIYADAPSAWFESIRPDLESNSNFEFSPSDVSNLIEFLFHTHLISQVNCYDVSATVILNKNPLSRSRALLISAAKDFFSVNALSKNSLIDALNSVFKDEEGNKAWMEHKVELAQAKIREIETEKQMLANEIEIYANSTWT